MAGNFDLHAALADGDPEALVACRIPLRIAVLAAAARKERLSASMPAPVPLAIAPTAPRALPSSPRNPTMRTAPQTSRAVSVASVHLGPINESRRRCGLPPLAAAEIEREFSAAAARAPARSNIGSHRTNASSAATDSMWRDIVARLNATVPARAKPIDLASGGVGSQPTTPRAVDWGAIAGGLNAEAGLKKPLRTNAR